MKVIPRDQHCISRKNISNSALKVMARLREQDFKAYLVGGAVRDLLLGGRPKDFDVATDATPEEVHALFRNSRIIGRRFRIVHVRFGPEIIEVTTFRGHHDEQEDEAHVEQAQTRPQRNNAHSRRSANGLLLRDNVYGTLEEDAVRRDLSINALYYNAADFSVYDQVNGLHDLQQGVVRVIGEPAQRYREDPVRMLRVLRFAARLGFRIEHKTAAAIREQAHLLDEIPAARLFDEMLKLFLAGYAANTLTLLRRYGVLNHLFAESARAMDRDVLAAQLVAAAMRNTDKRVREDKPVTPAFVLAAMLWPLVAVRTEQLREHGEPGISAVHSAGQQIITEACHRVAIPRRFSQSMREIWEFQQRLTAPRGRKAMELLQHRRFRAAYDFLLLREQAGEDCGGMGEWWTQMQELDPQQQLLHADALVDTGQRDSGKRSRRKQRSRG